ncbi:uncharacterized protein LOC121378505 [Gigantopelta aegis]|uniref:uncharacterized protein LOC121378505 n=1 Tax=Gigantopelta aegis TaxID=1735272 RepID=UPI001B88D07B|nr:uncharacterized protein LOC121378505 [Gigantopelta aegis]
MDSNTETVRQTTGPLPRWESFLSDLTPRLDLPPKPYKTVGKHSGMTFGQSISKIFMTNLLNDDHSGDDLSLSGSKWTLEMFSKYINFEHIDQLLIDTDGVDQSEEMKRIAQKTMDMFCAPNTNHSLENVLATEADVRIHLSAMLREMCPKLGLILKTETQIVLNCLPTCKFDFLFLTRGGKPVGCMEAKVSSTMNKKAFVQAVVQLLVLQQLAYQDDVDISTVPLFNVLSDGQRFVLMQVRGEKLCLEYVPKTGKNVLKVRTTKVMEALCKLIKMTLNNIENPGIQTS